MRDGSWTGAILGRLNLVVRASQMVKLVLGCRDGVCAAPHDDMPRPFTQSALATPPLTSVALTAKLITFHFQIGLYPRRPCWQVRHYRHFARAIFITRLPSTTQLKNALVIYNGLPRLCPRFQYQGSI